MQHINDIMAHMIEDDRFNPELPSPMTCSECGTKMFLVPADELPYESDTPSWCCPQCREV